MPHLPVAAHGSHPNEPEIADIWELGYLLLFGVLAILIGSNLRFCAVVCQVAGAWLMSWLITPFANLFWASLTGGGKFLRGNRVWRGR